MFSYLKNHPFAVEAFFDRTLVLTFAVPKEELNARIPDCLEPDVFDDQWAFVAIAMVQTRKLRPKGFPGFLGNDFFLIGYRFFVRYTNAAGRRLRGLYILKSETDTRKMEFLGNIFTHYQYTTTDIDQRKTPDGMLIRSVRSGFAIEFDEESGKGGAATPLPEGSPFKDWKEARRFAGPLPFTFSFDPEKKEVLIVEGLREDWIPRPVKVKNWRFPVLDSMGFREVRLANAFAIENIPYQWKKGRIEKWNGKSGESEQTKEDEGPGGGDTRGRFQGVFNIVRFNRHFYILSCLIFLAGMAVSPYLHDLIRRFLIFLLLIGLVMVINSLLVSFLVYDVSNLYTLDWLDKLASPPKQMKNGDGRILNIHAGFDETSIPLQARYPDAELTVLDFFDPLRNTEVSIKRARAAYPPYPGTLKTAGDHLPLPDGVAGKIFVIFSAHEIRDEKDRVVFFGELRRVLEPGGQIVVIEHLRDLPNFLAYTVGFFHFFSPKSWRRVFERSG